MTTHENGDQTVNEEREHLVYLYENGDPDECVEYCPGCHWEGNLDCEALRSGCDICDPDGVLAEAAR